MSNNNSDKSSSQIIHEVRNAVNTISMSTEVAMVLLESNFDKEKFKKLMQSILKQCEHCGVTLDEFDASLD